METLVVCVDRDDDIGRKTKAVGPIIGVEANIEVAKDLALADPEDTDTNAIFAAVKIAKEMGFDVVTLTGDKNVGVVSDTKLGKQLDQVLEQFKPESVILVIDGAEDAQILPVIESRVKINSVKTVIVRQSEELEKAYFKITNFIKELESDPNLARLIFGVPALVLLLLAAGWASGMIDQAGILLLSMLGFYLFMKGFGYEEEFFWRLSQFFKSLSVQRVSTFAYIIAVVVFFVALGYGYVSLAEDPASFLPQLQNILFIDYLRMLFEPSETMQAYATFIAGSLNMMFAAVVIAVLGKLIVDYSSGKYLNVRTDLISLAFALLVKLTIESWAGFIDNPLKVREFMFSILAGVLIFMGVIKLTEYSFSEEIQEKKKVLATFAGKQVYDEKGEFIGKVTKVFLDDSKLVGIKVKAKTIQLENIISSGEKIVVHIEKTA